MTQNMIKTLALVLGLQLMSSDKPDLKHSEVNEYCLRFKALLVDIREMSKTPDEAKNEFKEIMKGLASAYQNERFDSTAVAITFPMRLIDYRRVGGSNGNGYLPRHFDLFDHKKKGSHPAQDIFLRDANADAIDDRLRVPLELVATTDGLVIAVEQNWQKDSEYRGGNYAWIYDYKNKGLWYYAHASEISVSPGDEVLAGDEIGITGRTGFNAAKLRSETHLHLMFLKIGADFLPKPMNTYNWLKKAKVISKLNEKRPEIKKMDFGDIKPMQAKIFSIPFLDLRMASDRPVLIRPFMKLG